MRAYLIILLVLIPYFFCTTGVLYQMFDYPRAITLNSEGEQYDVYYIHDQETIGAKWMANNAEQENIIIYTDWPGRKILISQAGFFRGINSQALMSEHAVGIKGFIYLRYYNVVDGKLFGLPYGEYNITDYSDVFVIRSKIYNNGGAEIWK